MTLTALVLLVAGEARATPPIVAVFEVEAPLAAKTRSALTEFIGAQLVASGNYRILPRTQIKQRLVQLRKESYKDCYDASCQIAIGRELSANKSLATQISRLGDQCVLTITLHDLHSGTAEAAETVRASCDENALVGAAEAAAKALGAKASGAKASGPSTQPSASLPDHEAAPTLDTPRVSLFVSSTPDKADVLVDGLAWGRTPTKLTLLRGRPVILDLVREGYQPARRQVVGGEQVKLDVALNLTEARRLDLATTSEWVGVGFGAGGMSGKAGIGVQARLGTIKWHRVFWTLVEIGVVVTNEDNLSFSTSRDTIVGGLFGSRVGYPIYLGGRGQHQVLLGVGAAAMVSEARDGALFALSPGIDYVANMGDGVWPMGFGLRVFLPLQRQDGSYPVSFMVTANIGFSLHRFLHPSAE